MEKLDKVKAKAFEAYMLSAGAISKVQLAKSFNVSISAVRKWAKAGQWDEMLNVVSCPKRLNQPEPKKNTSKQFLPEETVKIIEATEHMTGEEILWQNILLQYAAIIRSQKLLDIEENKIVQIEKREAVTNDSKAKEWENFTPWERCKIYLDTQSRAMTALTNMLNKYEDFKHKGLQNEELSAKIESIRNKVRDFTEKNSAEITVLSEIPAKKK